MSKKVFRVHLTRVIESYVDVIAESESDAEDMCLVGIEVKEDGRLSARSDMENLVVGHDATRYNDEIDGRCFTEDVTEEYKAKPMFCDDEDEDEDEAVDDTDEDDDTTYESDSTYL